MEGCGCGTHVGSRLVHVGLEAREGDVCYILMLANRVCAVSCSTGIPPNYIISRSSASSWKGGKSLRKIEFSLIVVDETAF